MRFYWLVFNLLNFLRCQLVHEKCLHLWYYIFSVKMEKNKICNFSSSNRGNILDVKATGGFCINIKTLGQSSGLDWASAQQQLVQFTVNLFQIKFLFCEDKLRKKPFKYFSQNKQNIFLSKNCLAFFSSKKYSKFLLE